MSGKTKKTATLMNTVSVTSKGKVSKSAVIIPAAAIKALDVLKVDLTELSVVYANTDKLEDKVLTNLTVFFYNACQGLPAKCSARRTINRQAEHLVQTLCPNMPYGTRALIFRIAKSEDFHDQIGMTKQTKPGTVARKAKALPKEIKGEAKTLTGIGRKVLPKPKSKPASAPRVTRIGSATVPVSPQAELVVSYVREPILDALPIDVVIENQSAFDRDFGALLDRHMVDKRTTKTA